MQKLADWRLVGALNTLAVMIGGDFRNQQRSTSEEDKKTREEVVIPESS